MSVVLQPFLLQVSLSTEYTNHQFQTKRPSVFGYLFSANNKLKKGHEIINGLIESCNIRDHAVTILTAYTNNP